MEQKTLDNKDVVEFDSKKHQYRINGEIFPSVTQILNSSIAKPALLPWGVKITTIYLGKHLDKIRSGELKLTEENSANILYEAKKEHQRIKEEAGDVGAQSHRLVERINKGEDISSDWDNLDMRVQNAVNSYRKWRDENRFIPIENEVIVYSKKHRFAGRLDSLGRINGELVLVDYKTSNAIWPEMFLQTSAYFGAYSEMFPSDEKIKKIIIVRFGKTDSQFEVMGIDDISLIKNYYEVFLSAYDIWKWQKQVKKTNFSGRHE